MRRSEAVDIMGRALEADHGLLLQVSDPETAVTAFKNARKHTDAPELDVLEFRRVGFDAGNLVIVKRAPMRPQVPSEMDL